MPFEIEVPYLNDPDARREHLIAEWKRYGNQTTSGSKANFIEKFLNEQVPDQEDKPFYAFLQGGADMLRNEAELTKYFEFDQVIDNLAKRLIDQIAGKRYA